MIRRKLEGEIQKIISVKKYVTTFESLIASFTFNQLVQRRQGPNTWWKVPARRQLVQCRVLSTTLRQWRRAVLAPAIGAGQADRGAAPASDHLLGAFLNAIFGEVFIHHVVGTIHIKGLICRNCSLSAMNIWSLISGCRYCQVHPASFGASITALFRQRAHSLNLDDVALRIEVARDAAGVHRHGQLLRQREFVAGTIPALQPFLRLRQPG